MGLLSDCKISHNLRQPLFQALPGTLLSGSVTDGDMNYASISELGMLLVHLLAEVKVCALDATNDCTTNTNIIWALGEAEKVKKNCEPRKSTQVYIKNMSKMYQKVMLGIRDLAEAVRPHGLKCFSMPECKGKLDLATIIAPFREAVKIQGDHMVQTSATVTLLYMPSYEV